MPGRPLPIAPLPTRSLLARDLLSPNGPYTPITPSSSFALSSLLPSTSPITPTRQHSPLVSQSPSNVNATARGLSISRDALTRAPSNSPRAGASSGADTPFHLSAPPTPTCASRGSGVLVKLSDGVLAVRTVRKTLRINEGKSSAPANEARMGEEEVQAGAKGKCKGEMTESMEPGTEVIFKTDGSKCWDVKKRE